MLKEALGIREGILADLHNDHEEVSSLFSRILKNQGNHERGELFHELMDKLLAHLQAEQKILYRRLQKSENTEARKFAFEGEVEHEVVESQLQQLARARNKDSEQWTARLSFLQEAVEKHVKEEESTGFSCAHQEFDTEALQKLGRQFQREKEKVGA
jgi:iron-sulfur cluster repair protein YtfE (RIC family)